METNVLAREILAAYENGTVIEAPTVRFENFDVNAAYTVEAEFARLRGHKRAGLKVGYANKAMWRVMKLETLVWARMYDDTVVTTNRLQLPYYRSPKIEPEIVFKLRDAVNTAGLDAESILKHVEWLALGFEIIDCPFLSWEFKPADFVAAFGLHLRLAVGEPAQVDPAAIPTLAAALAQFKVRLSKNGEFVEEGAGKNSLRSPALCLAELASRTPLLAGDLVSSGTLTNGQPITKGDRWYAEVEGLPIPGLTLAFE